MMTVSSSKAGCVVVTDAACQVVWLRWIVYELHQKQMNPTIIYCDWWTIAIPKNPVHHSRTSTLRSVTTSFEIKWQTTMLSWFTFLLKTSLQVFSPSHCRQKNLFDVVKDLASLNLTLRGHVKDKIKSLLVIRSNRQLGLFFVLQL